MRSSFICPLILIRTILCVGLFLLISVRPEHDWGDDFAQYILLAGNIANGRPYQDTGYIVNPDHLSIGPSAYPPVFPLILAPVYAVFGLDLMAHKYVICFSFIATLLVLFLLFRKTHDFFARIAQPFFYWASIRWSWK